MAENLSPIEELRRAKTELWDEGNYLGWWSLIFQLPYWNPDNEPRENSYEDKLTEELETTPSSPQVMFR